MTCSRIFMYLQATEHGGWQLQLLSLGTMPILLLGQPQLSHDLLADLHIAAAG
jgi:hypothetical protein